MVKRYYAVLAPAGYKVDLGQVKANLKNLYGVVSSVETSLKVVEDRPWGIVVRAIMRSGRTSDAILLALSFTKAGTGWLQPIACSGTIKALRTKLKEAGLPTGKSG